MSLRGKVTKSYVFEEVALSMFSLILSSINKLYRAAEQHRFIIHKCKSAVMCVQFQEQSHQNWGCGGKVLADMQAS